jgi:hypothetical protein
MTIESLNEYQDRLNERFKKVCSHSGGLIKISKEILWYGGNKLKIEESKPEDVDNIFMMIDCIRLRDGTRYPKMYECVKIIDGVATIFITDFVFGIVPCGITYDSGHLLNNEVYTLQVMIYNRVGWINVHSSAITLIE